jgi:protein-L-isoaspartate(D-aspartate) O-methyltransferase
MQITESMRRGIGMTSERTRRRLVDRLREAGIRDSRVLDVIFSTPRHLFVDEALASRAYEDTALPIGHGQTISQPYTVARMTELALAGGDRETVLEVGTGCGYQASVLAQLVKRVYTVERIDALLSQARKRFRQLRLSNVRSRHADGQWGWPESGPYDAILVAAAPEEVPKALLTQLAPGGCLVLPVGAQGRQRLAVIRHTAEGFVQEDVEMASFVPLLGGSV